MGGSRDRATNTQTLPGDARAKRAITRLEVPSAYAELELGFETRSLYTRLAAEGPLPVDDLERSALQALVATGLVIISGDRADAVPPTGPLLALSELHTQRAVAARQAIDDLTMVWRTARSSEVGVEVVSGAAADRVYRDGLAASEREILALAIGPRAGKTIEPAPGVIDALGRGVAVRVVYNSRVFESESAIAVTEACMAAGEEARVLPGVPVNLTIMDDFATMNVSYNSDEPIHVAYTRNRRVVDSWRAIFQSFWQLAMPLDQHTMLADGPDDDFRQLVRLLSLGLTDRAIARELDVSERTIGRRVTRLQEHLGADTRFQLGLQLAIRGWV